MQFISKLSWYDALAMQVGKRAGPEVLGQSAVQPEAVGLQGCRLRALVPARSKCDFAKRSNGLGHVACSPAGQPHDLGLDRGSAVHLGTEPLFNLYPLGVVPRRRAEKLV